MRKILFIVLLLLSFVLASCGGERTSTGEKGGEEEIGEGVKNEAKMDITELPTVDELLESNPNADLFILNGIIYNNAQNIEWVNKLELEIGSEVAEIKQQSTNPQELKDYAATILPVGTKIYEPTDFRGPVYIAVVNGTEIRYFGLTP
jgi:hypothetical protein